jgi:hypothetical protein
MRFVKPLGYFWMILLTTLPLVARAEGGTSSSRALIQTHWTTLGGMRYLKDEKQLSGRELKSLIESLEDPEASALLKKSETSETLGFVELGGSVVLSVASVFFPNDHLHVLGLDISMPFLPLALPGTFLGVLGGLHQMEAGTAKYASVQRYNRLAGKSDSLAWNLAPQKDGLGLGLTYSF